MVIFLFPPISSFTSFSSLFLFHFLSISSLPTIWFQPKYIVVISLLISIRCLLFPHWSPSTLPFMSTVVGYLRLIGSSILFSLDFVFVDHLISSQIHYPNLFPNFSSSSIVPSSILISVTLYANHSWIFEVSRFSKSRSIFA